MLDLASFRCDVTPERGRVRIAPVGRLDITAAPKLDATLRELRESGWDDMLVDLRAVHSLEPAGLRPIRDLQAAARDGSLQFELIAGPAEPTTHSQPAIALARQPTVDGQINCTSHAYPSAIGALKRQLCPPFG